MKTKGRSIMSSHITRELIKTVNLNKTYIFETKHKLEIVAYKTPSGIRIKVQTRFDLHKNINDSRWFSDNLPNLENIISGFIGRHDNKSGILYWSHGSKFSLFELAESIRKSEEKKYDDFLDYIDSKSKKLNISDDYSEMNQHEVYIWKDLINQYVERKNESKTQ